MKITVKSLLLNFFLILMTSQALRAQDSLIVKEVQDSMVSALKTEDKSHQFAYRKMIVPAVLISYGVASLSIPSLKNLNSSTQFEISEHKPDHIRLDNYTQFAPGVLVYGINAFGVQGKHNIRDRSIIYGTSLLLVSAITLPLKHITKEEDRMVPIIFRFRRDTRHLLLHRRSLCTGNIRILIFCSEFQDILSLFLQVFTEC